MNRTHDTLCALAEDLCGISPFGAALSLEQPEHAALVAAQFGGEDNMRQRYPILYEAFSQARRQPSAKNAALPNGFCDMAKVIDVAYDKAGGCAYAVGKMDLAEKAQRLYLSIDIFDDADKRIAHSAQFFSSCWTGDIQALSAPTAPLPEGRMYRAVLQASWEPAAGGGLCGMLATAVGHGAGTDMINSVEVTAPHYQGEKKTGNILVVYFRSNVANTDYYYSPTRHKSGNVNVMLDISGAAYFKDSRKLGSVSSDSCGAILRCPTKGDVLYLNPITYGETEKEGNVFPVTNDAGQHGIGWKLNNQWNNYILESVREGVRDHEFELSLDFKLDNNLPQQLLITSIENELLLNQPHCEPIPKITLLWGCLAENTPVLMADGSTKPIQSIRAGDYVQNGKTGRAAVVNVVTGVEDTLYVLKTMSGNEVRASQDHPFLTDRGFCRVLDMDSSMSVVMEDGARSVIDYCYPEAQSTAARVYHLELEDGNDCFVAGGMVSGTYIVQGEVLMAVGRAEEDEQLSPETAAEYARMLDDLKNGLL